MDGLAGTEAAGWAQGQVIALVPDLISVLESETGRAIGTEELKYGTAHSSKERRRPLFWQPFWTVAEPAPGLLVPLSGILASRRREQRKNGEKTSKNGRDTAI